MSGWHATASIGGWGVVVFNEGIAISSTVVAYTIKANMYCDIPVIFLKLCLVALSSTFEEAEGNKLMLSEFRIDSVKQPYLQLLRSLVKSI